MSVVTLQRRISFNDRALFRAWLRERMHDTVGYAGACSACPLVAYATSLNIADAYIDGERIGFADDDSGETLFRSLVQWQCDFVEAIDDYAHERAYGGMSDPAAITGREAITILNRVQS